MREGIGRGVRVVTAGTMRARVLVAAFLIVAALLYAACHVKSGWKNDVTAECNLVLLLQSAMFFPSAFNIFSQPDDVTMRSASLVFDANQKFGAAQYLRMYPLSVSIHDELLLPTDLHTDFSVPIRVHRPSNAPPTAAAIVYAHGGGWVLGTAEGYDAVCSKLADAAHAVVLAVEYRRPPEEPFPAAFSDVEAVVRYVRGTEGSNRFKVDSSRVAVAGDSAGGNLAAAVALSVAHDGLPPLRGQMLVYPVVDHDFTTPSYRENARGYLLSAEMMQWFWSYYVPDETLRDDARASPLRAESVRGAPPAVIITVQRDVLRSEGVAYGQRLESEGVEVQMKHYDDLVHGFVGMLGTIPQADEALEELGEWFRGVV